MSPKKTRFSIGCLAVLFICLGGCGLLWWTGMRSREKQAQEERTVAEAHTKASAEHEHRMQEVLVTLVARHNAVVEWKKKDDLFYTVDMQEAMIRQDGRPIIFTAYLQDIIKTPQAYRFFFSPSLANALFSPPLLDWPYRR